jgi:2-keto-4-pentenoate hydratase
MILRDTPTSPPAQPSADTLQAAAQALRGARQRRQPISPIAATFGLAGIDAAYAVAELNTQARLVEGRRVVGKKVGLTSRAVQQQLGVDQPDFGVLFDDMEFLDGDTVPADRLIQPKVEAELAFVVGRDLRHEAPTYGEFIAALDCALPAIEVVDSAIADWRITLVDTVADNASSGLYVLGLRPLGIGRLAHATLDMQLAVNGHVRSTGNGAACLGHPLRAAYWLARTMAARGQPLRAGELVLSGALGPMVPVTAGDHVQVRVDTAGDCAVRFD